MPATAEKQHLSGAIANTTDDPNNTRDQRLDPVKAINAVARYLAYLIKRQGNVELGVAAYNAGPGTVDEAVAKCGGDRENPNVISLLPYQETKDYVSRFLARQKGYSYLDSTGVTQE
jgi:membrane-bound lytic murein transglycosylase D